MTRLLVATRNPGKLRELRPLLTSAGFEPVDLVQAGMLHAPDEEAIESHTSFEANALAKARHFHSLSGLPVVADDSGLVVDVLGGEPGVRSKRWSGRSDLGGRALDDANNAKLVTALAGKSGCAARFVCAAAYVDDAREFVTRGEVEGVVVSTSRGTEGFGYDPYFHATELRATFGEASLAEKERVSHRARAFRALVAAVSPRR